MMTEDVLLSVIVEGYPLPLDRARSGNGRHYDTPKNEAHKQSLRLAFGWKLPPIDERVDVELVFFYTRAKPTADVDNLAKMVLDAMNKVVLRDDVLVMSLSSRKLASQALDATLVRVVRYQDPDPWWLSALHRLVGRVHSHPWIRFR